MKITAHRIADAPWREAHSYSRDLIKPSLIVLHDTAGRLDKFNSVAWFENPECKVSAHIIIERDGTIVQCVPFNMRAFHAGKSAWQGKPDCNHWSIGIELVNPGKLDKDGRAWFHKTRGDRAKWERGYPTAGLKRVVSPMHDGEGWWMEYTAEQIAATNNLCRALVGTYGITDITTHWAIRRELGLTDKVDVGPLFPVEEVRRAALTRSAPVAVAAASTESADEAPDPAPITPLGQEPKPVTIMDRIAPNAAMAEELVQKGSRIAQPLKSLTGMFWRFWAWLLALLGLGSQAVNPKAGPAEAAASWGSQHPIQLAILCVLGTALLITGYVYWRAKQAEKGLVSAAKAGRYVTRAGETA